MHGTYTTYQKIHPYEPFYGDGTSDIHLNILSLQHTGK
uniref:Uncharacterized protein n=1 Tax=viral metagenome TaxID=1070528 RepID=A0A6C0JZG5_9ZZZZ